MVERPQEPLAVRNRGRLRKWCVRDAPYNLVIERKAVIDIVAEAVNQGTTAIIDGQVSCPLQPGDRVTIRRFNTDFMLVHNPLYPKWHNLVTKLHWGRAPSYE